MSDYNDSMQRSEAMIASILIHLMRQGITWGQLSFEDLELEDELRDFFIPCINWLINEGIIRSGDIHTRIRDGGGTVANPVLTSLGFAILDRKIVLGGKEERLGEVVKKVSSGKQSFSQFGDFVGGILGGFTKSLGS